MYQRASASPAQKPSMAPTAFRLPESAPHRPPLSITARICPVPSWGLDAPGFCFLLPCDLGGDTCSLNSNRPPPPQPSVNRKLDLQVFLSFLRAPRSGRWRKSTLRTSHHALGDGSGSSCPQPLSAGAVTLPCDLQKPLTFGVSERIKIGNCLHLPHGVDGFHSSHGTLAQRAMAAVPAFSDVTINT